MPHAGSTIAVEMNDQLAGLSSVQAVMNKANDATQKKQRTSTPELDRTLEHLKSRVIAIAHDSGRCDVRNGTQRAPPSAAWPTFDYGSVSLPEPEPADPASDPDPAPAASVAVNAFTMITGVIR